MFFFACKLLIFSVSSSNKTRMVLELWKIELTQYPGTIKGVKSLMLNKLCNLLQLVKQPLKKPLPLPFRLGVCVLSFKEDISTDQFKESGV